MENQENTEATENLRAAAAENARDEATTEALSRKLNEMLEKNDQPDAKDQSPVVRLVIEGHPIGFNPQVVVEQATPADIINWSDLLGRAKCELRETESRFNHWRSQHYATLLKKDSKINEWKCRTAVQALPEYLPMQTAIGAAERNVEVLQGVLEALRR